MREILYRNYRITPCEYGPGYVFERIGDPESCGMGTTVEACREAIDEMLIFAEDDAARRAERRKAAMVLAGDGC